MEESVITSSEICIVLEIIRKPNPILFYYLFKIVQSMPSSCRQVPVFISLILGQFRIYSDVYIKSGRYSSNSSCHPSSCILAVLTSFQGSSLLGYSSSLNG